MLEQVFKPEFWTWSILATLIVVALVGFAAGWVLRGWRDDR
jgi:hypothetical protein